MEEERDGGEDRHGEHDALCLKEFFSKGWTVATANTVGTRHLAYRPARSEISGS